MEERETGRRGRHQDKGRKKWNSVNITVRVILKDTSRYHIVLHNLFFFCTRRNNKQRRLQNVFSLVSLLMLCLALTTVSLTTVSLTMTAKRQAHQQGYSSQLKRPNILAAFPTDLPTVGKQRLPTVKQLKTKRWTEKASCHYNATVAALLRFTCQTD